MAELFVGDEPVISAVLARPRTGVWHADVVLDAETAPSGRVSLTAADGSVALSGSIARAVMQLGVVEARIVGGAGALGTLLTPRYYRDATTGLLVGDILRECGEALSTASDAQVLATAVGTWTRAAGGAGTALTQCLPTGAVWRVLDDGTVWVGTETWPVVEIDGDATTEATADSGLTLGSDAFPNALRPGAVFSGRRVSYVEYALEEQRTRTRVWFEADNARADRGRAALDAITRHVMRSVLYHALWPATVLGQASDGTLELHPDGTTLPMLVAVPIRSGAPGIAQTVKRGARVLVGFEAGEAAAPVVVAFAGDAATQETLTLDGDAIKLGAGATRGVARMSDTVARNTALATWMTAVTTATGVPAFPGSEIGAISSASAKTSAV